MEIHYVLKLEISHYVCARNTHSTEGGVNLTQVLLDWKWIQFSLNHHVVNVADYSLNLKSQHPDGKIHYSYLFHSHVQDSVGREDILTTH